MASAEPIPKPEMKGFLQGQAQGHLKPHLLAAGPEGGAVRSALPWDYLPHHRQEAALAGAVQYPKWDKWLFGACSNSVMILVALGSWTQQMAPGASKLPEQKHTQTSPPGAERQRSECGLVPSRPGPVVQKH